MRGFSDVVKVVLRVMFLSLLFSCSVLQKYFLGVFKSIDTRQLPNKIRSKFQKPFSKVFLMTDSSKILRSKTLETF